MENRDLTLERDQKEPESGGDREPWWQRGPTLPGRLRLSDSGMPTVWDPSRWRLSCTTVRHTAHGDHTYSEDPGAPVHLGV